MQGKMRIIVTSVYLVFGIYLTLINFAAAEITREKDEFDGRVTVCSKTDLVYRTLFCKSGGEFVLTLIQFGEALHRPASTAQVKIDGKIKILKTIAPPSQDIGVENRFVNGAILVMNPVKDRILKAKSVQIRVLLNPSYPDIKNTAKESNSEYYTHDWNRETSSLYNRYRNLRREYENIYHKENERQRSLQHAQELETIQREGELKILEQRAARGEVSQIDLIEARSANKVAGYQQQIDMVNLKIAGIISLGAVQTSLTELTRPVESPDILIIPKDVLMEWQKVIVGR